MKKTVLLYYSLNLKTYTMKKSITILVLLLTTFSFSQIKKLDTPALTMIGKISPLGNLVVSIEKSDSNNYVFTYRDVNLSPLDVYKHFYFKETGSDFDNLYQIIIDGFDNPPKDTIVIEIPDGNLFISYTKNMGVNSVILSSKTTGVPMGFCRALSKRDINKLFGKK